MVKYTSKVFLWFKLPDSTREGFFRQTQVLRHVIASFGVTGTARLGKTRLDQSQSIGQLGLKNDDIITISQR